MIDAFLAAHPDFNNAASANAASQNWEWQDYDRQQWEQLPPNHQWTRFASKWRSIGADAFIQANRKLDLALPTLGVDSLMIRDCYREAEELVWSRALNLPDTGVIFTGQPGVGKTLFMWYLLVRLLNMKQVVLLHALRDSPLLFYHGTVYNGKNAQIFTLPTPPSHLESHPFIWSLLDLGMPDDAPGLAVDPSVCFPVQTSSPNPLRYKLWRKERGALYTGFPLWDPEELRNAARLSSKFTAFHAHLDAVRASWGNDGAPDFPNHGLNQFLQEVCPNQLPESTDDVFDILSDSLVSRFGPIPREVFRAMFNDFNGEVKSHHSALSVRFEELKQVVETMNLDDQFPEHNASSHRIVSYSHIGPLESGECRIDFRSEWIAHKFSEQLCKESEKELRAMIRYFSSIPETGGLAGRLFEPLVHRGIIAPGTRSRGSWALKPMEFNDSTTSPSFVVPDPESPETVDGFSKIKRVRVLFHPQRLSNDLASQNCNTAYYIPNTPNHPLFDSFVVNLDFNAGSGELWLLQMTTSDVHKGSAKGYLVVRQIIRRIQEILIVQMRQDPDDAQPAKKQRKEPPVVKVHYVLVRSTGQLVQEEPTLSKWVLPNGWHINTQQVDHRGDGYLLEFPLGPTGRT